MIMPGVQKPHCSPCISRKPSCSACSVPSGFAMPSMVRTSVPLACTANTVQDFTDLPSRSTVQAPQWLVSQPICGPVMFCWSRRKWMRSVRGSTKASMVLPFTVIVMWDLAIGLSPCPSAAGATLGARERAREHHAGHLGAVKRGTTRIARRRRDRLGGRDRPLHSRRIERGAEQDRGRFLRPQRGFADIGQPDRTACDFAAVEREHDGRGRGRIVADLALELFVCVAVSGGRNRDAYRREYVAGLERGEIGSLVELTGGNPPFTLIARDLVGRVQAHHHRRHIVAGIAVGNIAAERSEIAHLRVGDQLGCLAQNRDFLAEKIRCDQVVLRSHGADDDLVAFGAHPLELGYYRKIDEVCRGCET